MELSTRLKYNKKNMNKKIKNFNNYIKEIDFSNTDNSYSTDILTHEDQEKILNLLKNQINKCMSNTVELIKMIEQYNRFSTKPIELILKNFGSYKQELEKF